MTSAFLFPLLGLSLLAGQWGVGGDHAQAPQTGQPPWCPRLCNSSGLTGQGVEGPKTGPAASNVAEESYAGMSPLWPQCPHPH